MDYVETWTLPVSKFFEGWSTLARVKYLAEQKPKNFPRLCIRFGKELLFADRVLPERFYGLEFLRTTTSPCLVDQIHEVDEYTAKGLLVFCQY